MGIIRLIEKKLGDARFRKNEEAILKAFFDCGSSKYSVAGIARRARIDRATFYRHHKTVYEIVPDYEKVILARFNQFLQGISGREDMTLRTVYYRLLVFILKNRVVFVMFIKERRIGVIGDMIKILIPKVGEECRLFGDLGRVFRVYIGEIVSLIVEWGEDGFQEKEIMRLLDDIMYLTKTIRGRLLPLIN